MAWKNPKKTGRRKHVNDTLPVCYYLKPQYITSYLIDVRGAQACEHSRSPLPTIRTAQIPKTFPPKKRNLQDCSKDPSRPLDRLALPLDILFPPALFHPSAATSGRSSWTKEPSKNLPRHRL